MILLDKLKEVNEWYNSNFNITMLFFFLYLVILMPNAYFSIISIITRLDLKTPFIENIIITYYIIGFFQFPNEYDAHIKQHIPKKEITIPRYFER